MLASGLVFSPVCKLPFFILLKAMSQALHVEYHFLCQCRISYNSMPETAFSLSVWLPRDSKGLAISCKGHTSTTYVLADTPRSPRLPYSKAAAAEHINLRCSGPTTKCAVHILGLEHSNGSGLLVCRSCRE